jgi:hypothetical protein
MRENKIKKEKVENDLNDCYLFHFAHKISSLKEAKKQFS